MEKRQLDKKLFKDFKNSVVSMEIKTSTKKVKATGTFKDLLNYLYDVFFWKEKERQKEKMMDGSEDSVAGTKQR